MKKAEVNTPTLPIRNGKNTYILNQIHFFCKYCNIQLGWFEGGEL